MQHPHLRKRQLILLVIISGLIVVFIPRFDRPAEPSPHATLVGKFVVGAGAKDAASSPRPGTPLGGPDAPSVAKTSQKLERWKLVTRDGWITLVDPQTGAINPALAALMELSPQMQSAITEKIESMMEVNAGLECRRAYVSVEANGDEEIVVPPSEDNEVLDLFKASLYEIGLAEETADFLMERAFLDPNLGLLNTPITLAIQLDGNSATRMTTYGKVSGRMSLAQVMEARASDYTGRSPIVEITMQGALEGAAGKRFSHLWKEAATFPRMPARSSNGSSLHHPGSE